MARKKEAPKFTGPLAEPITVPIDFEAMANKLIRPHGIVERLEKLKLLAEHYGVGEGNWLVLVLALAIDFVPGFQLVHDDPLAGELGLPRAGGSKANRKQAQPWLWGPRLLAVVDMLKRAGARHEICQSDKECAELLFEAWRQPGRITQKQKLAGTRTLMRKMGEARRREHGPVVITRSKANLH